MAKRANAAAGGRDLFARGELMIGALAGHPCGL